MDEEDDAVPPPIRIRRFSQVIPDVEDTDSDSDEAAPPPIARSRSSSLNNLKAAPPVERSRSSSLSGLKNAPATPPVPQKSPLRTRPAPVQQRSFNFSYPRRDTKPKPKPIPPHSIVTNPRLKSIRRWSSLETIDSVPTIDTVPDNDEQSTNDGESIKDNASWADQSGAEEDSRSYATSSFTHSSNATSESWEQNTATPAPGVLNSRSHNRSASSLIRKLKPKKNSEPLFVPEFLEIEKRVSFDQRSEHTGSISSISSGPPSERDRPRGSNSSQTSAEWRASEFDPSGLTEAELKKCKKKGINPALYAEMKAARKGKWVSPLTGNTFL